MPPWHSGETGVARLEPPSAISVATTFRRAALTGRATPQPLNLIHTNGRADARLNAGDYPNG